MELIIRGVTVELKRLPLKKGDGWILQLLVPADKKRTAPLHHVLEDLLGRAFTDVDITCRPKIKKGASEILAPGKTESEVFEVILRRFPNETRLRCRFMIYHVP